MRRLGAAWLMQVCSTCNGAWQLPVGSWQSAVTGRQSASLPVTWSSCLAERHIPTWQWDFYFARLLPISLLMPIHVCFLLSPPPLTLFPWLFPVICRVSFAYKASAQEPQPHPMSLYSYSSSSSSLFRLSSSLRNGFAFVWSRIPGPATQTLVAHRESLVGVGCYCCFYPDFDPGINFWSRILAGY